MHSLQDTKQEGYLCLIEETILDAIKFLKSDKLTDSGSDCDFCKYRSAVSEVEKFVKSRHEKSY